MVHDTAATSLIPRLNGFKAAGLLIPWGTPQSPCILDALPTKCKQRSGLTIPTLPEIFSGSCACNGLCMFFAIYLPRNFTLHQ